MGRRASGRRAGIASVAPRLPTRCAVTAVSTLPWPANAVLRERDAALTGGGGALRGGGSQRRGPSRVVQLQGCPRRASSARSCRRAPADTHSLRGRERSSSAARCGVSEPWWGRLNRSSGPSRNPLWSRRARPWASASPESTRRASPASTRSESEPSLPRSRAPRPTRMRSSGRSQSACAPKPGCSRTRPAGRRASSSRGAGPTQRAGGKRSTIRARAPVWSWSAWETTTHGSTTSYARRSGKSASLSTPTRSREPAS